MKPISTLATSVLTLAALTAHAQFMVDGRVSASEIGTGIGKYQLVASYSGTHSLEADRGLKSLYMGYTATTLNIMLVTSAQSSGVTPPIAYDYRAPIIYLNVPAVTGAPAGVRLAGSNGGNTSPLKHRPTLDIQADYGIACSIGPGAADVYFKRVSYVGVGAGAGNDFFIGQGSQAGAVVTADPSIELSGSKFAYFNTASLAANSDTGMEIEIPLADLGTASSPFTMGSRIELLAAYCDGDGIFTTDVLPQIPNRTTTLGADPDFTAVPGAQALTYVVGTGVLTTRNMAKLAGFVVYPNPAQALSTVTYHVPAGQSHVAVDVYNALGQRLQGMNAVQAAGSHEYQLKDLAAGTYLVKLQLDGQLDTRKLVVQ